MFEKDTDVYGSSRDAVVYEAAQKAGVEVIIKSGRTLWDSDEIVTKNSGKPTMSITQLQAAGARIGEVSQPVPAPTSLPDPGEMPVDFDQEQPKTKPDINADKRTEKETAYTKIAGPNGDFAIETMEELGFPSATTPHKGGETVVLKMLDKIIKDKKYTATFEKPKTSPAQFDPQATTLLSPFIHFGALSVREFYWKVRGVTDSYKGASPIPVNLIGQILFRDMYFAAQAALGAHFHQTALNPTVRFVPWHLPSKRNPKTGLITDGYHVDSEQAEKWFQRWKNGVTGFPWIDALMRQLKQEGWIHHLGRHSVACFLTRGGCYIDWERGAEVFEEWLLDHEPAANAGNWQWLSCTAFFAQYFRCYSPISFGQKWDKHGHFVRRYVPELKDLDEKYIYEPWKAPIQDQRKAGVRVTGDGLTNQDQGTYPKPMFDFNERRKICIDAMKTAYNVGLYGNDEKVLNGEWRSLFPKGKGVEVRGEYESDDGGFADDADYQEDDKTAGDKRGTKKGDEDDSRKKTKT